jgi:hypothetical protein
MAVSGQVRVKGRNPLPHPAALGVGKMVQIDLFLRICKLNGADTRIALDGALEEQVRAKKIDSTALVQQRS